MRAPVPVSWTSKPGLRDEVKSVWVSQTQGEAVVASVSTASRSLKPVDRPHNALPTQWPIPSVANQPIQLEVIRESNDRWVISIDGMRCHERFAHVNDQIGMRWKVYGTQRPKEGAEVFLASLKTALRRGDLSMTAEQFEQLQLPEEVRPDAYVRVDSTFYVPDIATCGLPPPVPPNRPVEPTTASRKVVMTCRLEKEALAPAKVELVIDQVIHSSERRDQTYYNQDERSELERYSLKPYSVSEPTAQAHVLPYPFACVPQSVFGILDYGEVERFLEREDQHYDRMRRGKTARMFEETPPQLGEARVHRIGGEKVSASKSAANRLNAIVRAYDQLAAWEQQTGSLTAAAVGLDRVNEYRIEGVRYLLKEHGDHSALALWDALAFGPTLRNLNNATPLVNVISKEQISPPTPIVGNSADGEDDTLVIHVEGDEPPPPHASADTGAYLSPAQLNDRLELQVDFQKRMEQWKGLTFEFLYDRMLFRNRMATNLRLEYRIEITEMDGTIRTISIVPRRWYAYVAHSVYTRIDRDEQELRIAISNTLEVINRVQRGQPLASIVRDYVYDASIFPSRTYNEWATWLRGRRWYSGINRGGSVVPDEASYRIYGYPKYRRSQPVLNQMKNALMEMLLMCGYATGPVWPEPAPVDADEPLASMPQPAYVRKLPQIVVPKRDMRLPLLRVPDNVEAPDVFSRPLRGRESWWVWSTALAIGLTFGGLTFLPVYIWTYLSTTASAAYIAVTSAVSAGALGAQVGSTLGSVSGSIITLATSWIPYGGNVIGTLIGRVIPGAAAAAGFNIAIGSVASAALDFALLGEQIASVRGIYVGLSAGLPVLISSREAVCSYARSWVRRDEARLRAYRRAIREITAVPVSSVLSVARNAIHNLRELRMSLFVLGHEGNRFQITQAYEQIANMPQLEGDVSRTNDDWNSSPNNALLLLMPPVDITSAAYEATALRRVDVDGPMSITLGRPAKDVPITPSEISADVAYSDMIAAVEASRLPLRGESLFGSVALQSAAIANKAAKIIMAAYGDKAGVTYVGGGDDIWFCLPCGAAARLAMRHIAFFELHDTERSRLMRNIETARDAMQRTVEHAQLDQAELAAEVAEANYIRDVNAWNAAANQASVAVGLPTYEQQADRSDTGLRQLLDRRDNMIVQEGQSLSQTWEARRLAIEEAFVMRKELESTDAYKAFQGTVVKLKRAVERSWTAPYREQVGEFVAALVQEANGFSQSSGKANLLTTDTLARGAAASAKRMLAFDAIGDPAIGPLMAASGAPRIVRLFDPRSDTESTTRALLTLSAASTAAEVVSTASLLPRLANTTRVAERAAWAARRMDLDVMGIQAVASGNGVDSLITALSGLAVRSGDDATHYFCPTGSTLVSVPNKLPFDVRGEATRLIWLSFLLDALRIVRSAAGDAARIERANTHSIRTYSSTNAQAGLGRHPLVVTTTSDGTNIHLSSTVSNRAQPPDRLPSDVQQAASMLATAPTAGAGVWINYRTTVARAIAFNADRYKHAIAIAELHNPHKALVVDIVDGDRLAPVALALALAMHKAELGRMVTVVKMSYATADNAAEAKRVAENAAACCERASTSGYEWVHMNEVCSVLSQFG